MMVRKRGKRGKRVAAVLIGITAAAALALWGAEAVVAGSTQARCFSDPARLPEARVALVLGTNPKIAGNWPNLYYHARLDAAARLFRDGKVQYLLVSGDNGRRDYDEPTAMRQDLVRRGVPDDRIVCDYAGFRTLDSIIRAEKVFGQKRFIVVSQRFHNERALFIAQHEGLEAYGFDADDPPLPAGMAFKMWWRERFARVAAILDTTIWQRHPRFLGKPVLIGNSVTDPNGTDHSARSRPSNGPV